MNDSEDHGHLVGQRRDGRVLIISMERAAKRNAIDRAMADDTFRASLQKIGYSVKRPQSADEIVKFIDADRARWSAVVKERNISLD